MTKEMKTFCRNCGAQCGLVVEVDGQHMTNLRGDQENPVSKGYFCIKGEASRARQNTPHRLETSKKYVGGVHVPIATNIALDEIAERIKAFIEKWGPQAVGIYYGTACYGSTFAISFAKAWMKALGSPQVYSSQTIDQSPKTIAALRMGVFNSGGQLFESADVWVISGSNPIVSHLGGWGGNTMYAPGNDIRVARKRGMKLIVIDPRYTETARLADIHLQIKPGQDVAVYAGFLNIIFSENLCDDDFCSRYTKNIESLREAVKRYTPEYAAAEAGISASLLYEAAIIFGKGPRGRATSGTGPDMAPNANLAAHLIECLNVVCGRYRRAGELIRNPRVFSPNDFSESVSPPYPIWDLSPKMASHPSVGWALPDEYPSNLMADEILYQGDNRLRALIVVAGNPITAFPDGHAVKNAFEKLELLVSLDLEMNATCEISDYIISCKTPYEREDIGLMADGGSPFAAVQYTKPVIEAPPEAIEEWEFFYGLAQRMNLPFKWQFWNIGAPPSTDTMVLDLECKPTASALFNFICASANISFSTIEALGSGGQILELEPEHVRPGNSDDPSRLDLFPDEVDLEFQECFRTHQRANLKERQFLLHVRRLLYTLNSSFQGSEATRKRLSGNPLYINPTDVNACSLHEGDTVEIISDHGRIHALIKSDPTERIGSVSMHHSWPGLDVGRGSVSVGVLINRNGCRESHNFVPRMSAIPVDIEIVRGVLS
jgi:anaerobic selenocysteine-containing dehydrogenase